MTKKELKAAIKDLGMTVRERDGEIRINLKGNPESEAYYTNERQDALDTAKLIASAASGNEDAFCDLLNKYGGDRGNTN